jgi:hypothetical protein
VVDPVSLTIALVALGVSVYTAVQNYKQARASSVQAEELKKLRHERERPLVEVSAELVGAEARLVVANAGLDPVDRVEVELSAVKDDVRTRRLPDTQSWANGHLGRHQGARTSISLAGLDAGQIAVVIVKAAQGQAEWEWQAYVPVPPS